MSKRIWSTLESVLFVVLYPVVAAGIIVYFVRYMGSLVTREPAHSPLELATIAAALGGLILLGAFYRENKPLGPELKKIAKLFLGAAVSLTVLFFLFEMVASMQSTLGLGEWLVIVVTWAAMLVAGLSLGLALVLLIGVIRQL